MLTYKPRIYNNSDANLLVKMLGYIENLKFKHSVNTQTLYTCVCAYLPTQLCPSPVYPGLHVHLRLSMVLVQIASALQPPLFAAHSSMPLTKNTFCSIETVVPSEFCSFEQNYSNTKLNLYTGPRSKGFAFKR